jgi:Domain of unknown function (DUF4145)
MAVTVPKITAHCNTCRGETNQDILCADSRNWSNEQTGIRARITFEMLRCRGCEAITLRETHRSFNGIEWEEPTITYYPPAIARREPEWLGEFRFFYESESSVLSDLLKEIYTALQNGSPMLAGMGVRSLIELVMIEKIGDNGTFAKNLTAFEANGYISKRQADTLSAILDAGSATVHRGWKPSDDDLATLLDVAETVVETVYLHEEKVKELAKKVPPRQSQKKAPPDEGQGQC